MEPDFYANACSTCQVPIILPRGGAAVVIRHCTCTTAHAHFAGFTPYKAHSYILVYRCWCSVILVFVDICYEINAVHTQPSVVTIEACL